MIASRISPAVIIRHISSVRGAAADGETQRSGFNKVACAPIAQKKSMNSAISTQTNRADVLFMQKPPSIFPNEKNISKFNLNVNGKMLFFCFPREGFNLKIQKN